ncbi:HNH endonuclease family protein [Actinoallomurus spadix]|uniref:GmrSD restriction endonucleases C-terminal domain-containing protein n=1 Tax=Actinoallomurus spadix TaxID=79912 RepID=A0ABP3G1N5_9ACTN|nr:HNH endonuclease family protein [Actinoallomurus spadix]MCO5990408.1 HNH endonuclease family protein [Actinoallomurus spadix]
MVSWRVRAVAVAIPVLLVAGCKTSGVQTTGDGAEPHATKGNEATARKELGQLKVAVPDPMTGYSREKYGPAWKDVDDNGCDTRNDILARDLSKVKKRDKCIVISGELHDPYAGKDIHFTKAHASEVQIDHVVPLALAWRMGAHEWTPDKRAHLANDPANLLAVWGRPNMQKSDKGPSEWQPQKSFQCTYAERFIGVTYAYRLSVTRADRTALQGMLDTC